VTPDQDRNDYGRFSLLEQDIDPDPIVQFQVWFDQATRAAVPEPAAMALATATADGRPSVRMVLLRGVDARGFTFFTNYQSRKADEIDVNPQAALVFFWYPLERQVRIEGRVERTSASESDAYFHGRPRGARIGAWASPQSRVIASREELESRYGELENHHAAEGIPRPAYWGGYRLVPEAIEFWQGRLNRLHDRLRYTRLPTQEWRLERLAP
jgi:pyridoxamine 5'-phosphate oxidase